MTYSGRIPEVGPEIDYALAAFAEADARLPELLGARYVGEGFAVVLWIDLVEMEQTIDVTRRDPSSGDRLSVVSAMSDWSPPSADELHSAGGQWSSGLSAGTVHIAMGGPIMFASGLSDRLGQLDLSHGDRIVTSRRPQDRRDSYVIGRVVDFPTRTMS